MDLRRESASPHHSRRRLCPLRRPDGGRKSRSRRFRRFLFRFRFGPDASVDRRRRRIHHFGRLSGIGAVVADKAIEERQKSRRQFDAQRYGQGRAEAARCYF